MARRLRIQFPGALYHVLNRGDRRGLIFLDDSDRARFLETLGEACVKTGWQVHAFVLMPNHFHLVVETPEANLMAGMKWFLGTYTARFNRRHGVTGHLFNGRYKALVVGGKGGYLGTVVDYVHLNPVRAKLIGETRAIREFHWSSLPWFLGAPGQRPAWLRVDRALGECGISADSAAGRSEFERRLETRRVQGLEKEFHDLRHAWCFGDEAFRRELLEHSEKQIGRHHFGPELQESAEEEAERMVREELSRVNWSEEELRTRPKGDPMKLAVAVRLRAETMMTLKWIADRLGMGTKGHLSHLLYWRRRGVRPPKPPRTSPRRDSPLPRSKLPLPSPAPTTAEQNPAKPWTDAVLFDPSFD